MSKNIVEKTKNKKVIDVALDNNQKMKIIMMTVMSVLVVLYGVFSFMNNRDIKKDDNKKFKEEYESLNNKKSNGKKNVKVSINPKNIEYIDSEKALDIIENGTGVIYFGFPECPWCRNLVPVLLDASTEAGIDKIYYLNNKDERDTKKLENKKIVTEKEGTKEYYKLVEALDDVLWEYENLNDSSIKRIYYPMVLFIKDGKIVDCHIDTVSSQKDPYVKLDKKQYEELYNILLDGMYKTIMCDDAC